jgi:hypothetical protein
MRSFELGEKNLAYIILLGVFLFVLYKFYFEKPPTAVNGLGKAKKATPKTGEQAMLDFNKTAKQPRTKKQTLDLIIKARDSERSELERYKRSGDYKHEDRARQWHSFAQNVEDFYSINRGALAGKNNRQEIILL